MKRKEIIGLAGILLAAGILWLFLHIFGGKTGTTVYITVDGEEYRSASLEKEERIEIETSYGKNIVRIKDGYAYMEEADCPDGYCKRQGKIHSQEETIVCLPHRLVVEIR